MKNQKFKELTLEQLYALRKKLQNITIIIALFLLIAFCLLFYFAIATKKSVLIPTAIGSFATLIPSLMIINQINQEIKNKNSQ